MNLPTISNLDCEGKVAVVRADLDVDVGKSAIVEEARLKSLIPTLKALEDKDIKQVFILGHKGRPEGEGQSLSLSPLTGYFTEKLNQEVAFHKDIRTIAEEKAKFVLLENVRFDKGEEENSEKLAQHFAANADVYVNEAFGVSHRKHMSVYALPQKIREKGGQLAFGLRFEEELENLSKVRENPQRPSILYLSGAKEDKLKNLDRFKKIFDKVLVAGRLPVYLDEYYEDPKVVVARLLPDKEDITIHSIENFEQEAAKAETIVVSGPMGKFEDEGHCLGTKRVLEAVAESKAFKVAGGGDTLHALNVLGISSKFDWLSVGGGAMLEYISLNSLPGIEALLD